MTTRSGEPVPASSARRAELYLELAALYIALPVAVAAGWMRSAKFLPLWLATLYCLVRLLADQRFDRTRLGWRGTTRGDYLGVALRIAGFAAASALTVAALEPDQLFGLPRERPQRMLTIALLYPLLSAWPQELIFRAYFFHRYAAVLRRLLIPCNALLFAWLHLAYGAVAVISTLVAGVWLAQLYARRRSLGLVAVEHALLGIWVFAVGLGRYFFI